MSQRYIGGLIYNPPGGFSGYFDGSGDYLRVASNTNAALSLGTSDFTYEAWVYPTAFVSGSSVIGVQTQTNGTAGNGFALYLTNTGAPGVLAAASSGGYAVNFTGTAIPLNAWTHLAVTRSGNTFTLWRNGVSDGTATVSVTITQDSTSAYGGWNTGASPQTGQGHNGYISNDRVVKGTAVYTAAFTPPNGPLQAITNTSLLTCAYSTFRDGSTNNFTITVNGNTAVSTQNPFPLTTLPNPALGNQGNGVYSMSQYQSLLSQNLWPAVDPYWRYVTLMLHGNGTNGAQNNTFLDSSTNNFTITRNGNTTQGTFSPYGSNWSNYFDGSGDFLDFVSSTNATNFGTGDFTVEFWVYLPSVTSQQNLIDNLGGAQNAIYVTGGTLYWYVGANRITGTSALSPNVWQHISLCRASGTTRLFVNGTQVGSNYSDSNNYAGGTTFPRIGAAFNGTVPTNGYISNVRVVKGTALYTTTFTPSTSPLTAITNTSLLTCQSNRFIDNSTNAFTLTVNGNTSVQRFSPFNPTAPYAAGTDGGSGYFDGSGDTLSIPSSTPNQFGSGDFTIECWYYCTGSISTSGQHLFFRRTTTAAIGLIFQVDSSKLQLIAGDSNTSSWEVNISGATTLVAGTWYHFAATRSGSTWRIFVNGVQDGTATASFTIAEETANIIVGSSIAGYLSGWSVLKGTAQYTSNFTVPTAPPTVVASTAVLMNFTNAGIIDNAEMNNLETVGNAQISTAQSKFGGASMLFDGTGDYLVAAATPNLISSGSFTIEFWVYWNAIPSNFIALLGGTTANTQLFITTKSNGQGIRFGLTGVAEYAAGTQTWVTGTWYHIALVRNGTDVKFYVNGTNISDSTYTNSTTYSGALLIGGGLSGTADFNGYIDDLRITKGYARYTANFTPQRSQWQDQ